MSDDVREVLKKKMLVNIKSSIFAVEFSADYDALLEGCYESFVSGRCKNCEFFSQKECFKLKLAYCLYGLGYRRLSYDELKEEA